MRSFFTIMSLAFGLAAVATGQSRPADPAEDAHTALQRGEYLKADLLLRAAALNPDGSIGDESAFGSWEQVHPMLTGENPVGGLRPATASPTDEYVKERRILAAARPENAIDAIVRRAANTRIVILNEAHDSPRDRAFALKVAQALGPLGYTYLAAETFNNASDWGGRPTTADKLMRDGFVRRDTGYYTADPAFATFVREALHLGYRPVSYEQTEAQGIADPNGTIAKREEAEATNLVAALHAHPGAKIFVYVGYHHAAEAPIGEGARRNIWMAARLKQKTGVDPLTIDQTSVTDADRDLASLYRAAAVRISEPSVFVYGDQPVVVGPLAGAVDLQVVEPVRTYANGRPTWLSWLGGRPVPVPQSLLPRAGKRLVQAFAAGAPEDAIPLDQVIVEAGKPAPMLMVPGVKVRFAVQDPL